MGSKWITVRETIGDCNMTQEEVEAYQTARRGKYGWIEDGAELLSEEEPRTSTWWKYAESFALEVRSNKR
jgi:hypothetical protein